MSAASCTVEFRREALPPLAVLEHEWRRLEAAGRPSFFTSWHWIGTLLRRGAARRAGRSCCAAAPMARRSRWHCSAPMSAPPARAGSLAQPLSQRDRGSALRFVDDRAQRHPRGGRATRTVVWDELIAWFAGLSDEADELHIGGSLLRLPEAAVEGCGLREPKHASLLFGRSLPAGGSGGELYPVLSANARQQLRRALRYFERFGPLRLARRQRVAEALAFFDAMKALHCASWERRGRAAFLYRRVLRAVPSAADRAQLCRRRNPASQSLRRRPRYRLSL